MTGEAEKIQSEIKKLMAEIEELRNSICDYCEGEGEVIDRRRITVCTIDVPYCTCPECRGTGIID